MTLETIFFVFGRTAILFCNSHRATLSGPVATGHMDSLCEPLSLLSVLLPFSRPPAAAAPYVLHVYTVKQTSCTGLQVEMT